MTVRRLWVDGQLPAEGGELDLPRESVAHAEVLRLRAGDPVQLFDDFGHEADAVLRDRGKCDAAPAVSAPPDPLRVVLVQSLPKGRKLDDIVRSTTECGVAAIHLAISERSVSRPEGDRADHRATRLAKIAREASRQSLRSHVPDILPAAPLLEVATRAPPDSTRLLLDCNEDPRGQRYNRPETVAITGEPLATPNANCNEDPRGQRYTREVWVAVGPEGGFAAEEIRALEAAGWEAVGLPTPVLRVETAAPVAVAFARAGLVGGPRSP